MIQIPAPRNNGERLLVRWLRSTPEDRQLAWAILLLLLAFWLLGAYYAPQDVAGIGRLTGRWQSLAAFSMSPMLPVWHSLQAVGYVTDSLQDPSQAWWLLVWIGPAGVVYGLWLLHQPHWPWERPWAWLNEQREQLAARLHLGRRQRFRNGEEVLAAWWQLMAEKETGLQRPPVRQPAVQPGTAGQSAPAGPLATEVMSPVHPSEEPRPPADSACPPASETTGQTEPVGSESVQASEAFSSEPPQQMALPLDSAEAAPINIDEKEAPAPMIERTYKQRPGRPGAGHRRWRR